jgi:hypothetical protein
MAAKEHKARKENLAERGCVRSNPGHCQGAAAWPAATAAFALRSLRSFAAE